jgi:F0F1-type ATP synthase alpha subunit
MTKGAPNTKDTVPKDFHLTHGRVSSCKDGIIETEGLLNAPAGEIVELVGKDVKGIVINAGTAPVKILVLKWADGVTVDSDDFIRRRGFLDNGRGWNAITR